MRSAKIGMKALIFVTVLSAFIYVKWGEKVPDAPEIESVLADLPKHIAAWFERGQLMNVNGRNLFYIYEKCTNKKLTNPPTYVIVHGFPSSSFEYHKVTLQ